eukprot:jgi/Tetstr1/454393/TSEL_041300.t1
MGGSLPVGDGLSVPGFFVAGRCELGSWEGNMKRRWLLPCIVSSPGSGMPPHSAGWYSQQWRQQSPPTCCFTVLHSPVQPEQKLQRVEAVLDTWGAGQRVVVVTGDADEQPVRGTPVWHIANTTGAMSEVAVRTYLQRAMQESWDWLMHVDDNSLVLPLNLHTCWSPTTPQCTPAMANALHVVADSARDEANMGALFKHVRA